MHGEWIQSVDDFCWWVKQTLESSGGWLTLPITNEPDFQEGGLLTNVQGDDIPTIVMDQHRLEFWDPEPHMLDFSFDVALRPDGTREYLEAHYHLMTPALQLVWRYDFDDTHPELGPWHKHVDNEDNRIACEEVDLVDTINEIRTMFSWDPIQN